MCITLCWAARDASLTDEVMWPRLGPLPLMQESLPCLQVRRDQEKASTEMTGAQQRSVHRIV